MTDRKQGRRPRRRSLASKALIRRAILQPTMLSNAARSFAPILADIWAKVHASLQAIEAEMTERGIRTRRGGQGIGKVQGFVGRLSSPA